MGVAFALVFGASAVAWLLPASLHGWHRRRADPLMLIVVWVLAVVGVVVTVGAGVAMLFVPGHGMPGWLVSAVHGCWSAIRHGSAPGAEQVAGVVGGLVLLAVAVRFGSIAWRLARVRARSRRERLAMLHLAGQVHSGPPRMVWLQHDQPLAFSFPGRSRCIVATEGLRRHLTPDQLGAVLAHERAHLRGHHHGILGMAEVLATALPFVPLFREAPNALRDLIELSADSAAVREHGSRALSGALRRVGRHGAPPGGALAIGRDAVELRLAQLTDGRPLPSRKRRAFACGLAGTVAAGVPLLASSTLLFLVAGVFCPLA